ncbi:MAG: Type 4 prepilin-like protein leader peptide-processing enzyme [Candidatus Uhrbacteria bacterium GW2011_GWE2_40_58]|nr:MAG: Type 4 prepilin-like protein leader peptide-processing enzyme [Candidatus Uhrbacteria bacterium GW2011_GWF2_40_263]KKR67961.1 MAG: Type 4 prepilin-like protein leader peptide-processing enzyme [Candidatus Uhrbacteria bacterium GW2011_GWE2_40_58]OGL92407.1 MAG: hypothetical protein A2239_02165 [Candidatus Uhrbacteria bacterium RIFOXYA2_FULL_40_9]OGL96998.1 MAG: hypothetical protein A2332_03970 [Candidatus Uhrbacteria bacterium RIFOXYB2_FULL_41_18]HBK34764.1 hypothetical protein [Candidat
MIALFVFLFGISIGSFLNVIVFRTALSETIVKGRSKCLSCKHSLCTKDLIPVFGYLFLKGKCRYCQSKISWQYPLVEFLTGLVFLAFYFKYHFGIAIGFPVEGFDILLLLARDWIAVSVLLLIFIYDLRYSYILDRFTIPTIILVLLLNLWLGLSVSSLILGAVVIGGFFLVQYFVSKGKWVGGGDIRMGVLMGCLLGFRDGVAALFLAYVLGALVGLGLLATKRANRETEIPFGTFLSFTTLLMLFLGKWVIEWYLALFV